MQRHHPYAIPIALYSRSPLESGLHVLAYVFRHHRDCAPERLRHGSNVPMHEAIPQRFPFWNSRYSSWSLELTVPRLQSSFDTRRRRTTSTKIQEAKHQDIGRELRSEMVAT